LPLSLKVFIHRSIKTRIETKVDKFKGAQLTKFLYIDPLKQGLKLQVLQELKAEIEEFLYIDPLKQGLKLVLPNPKWKTKYQFLYIDPLKQGLKLKKNIFIFPANFVFIHRSIKTRIETKSRDYMQYLKILFLYIDPLKQGLKH